MTINKKVSARVQRILDIVQNSSHMQDLQLHYAGFAEPGHGEPPSGIIASANWNNDTRYDPLTKRQETVCNLPGRVFDLFERMGIDCIWSDEYATCDECYKVIRTSGDSYFWQPSYVETDDGCLCHECVMQDPVAHLESLEGDEHRCNTIADIDLEQYGYRKLSDHESGWFPGQNDTPRQVAKQLRDKGITRFVFNLDENSQFFSKWSVFVYSPASYDEPAEEDTCAECGQTF